jgi:predicted Zn-dependent protease
LRRYLPLAVILFAALAAIYVAERNKIATRPSPEAILSSIADTELHLSRLPDSFDRLSDADEIRIGDALAESYTSAWKRNREPGFSPPVEVYIQGVGAAVAMHAKRKIRYRFHYIAQPSFVNAFALPGGHVFVGEGLLRLMQSEDALAAVLGHEIEHVDLDHCAQRIQMERRLRNLGTLGALATIPVGVFTAGYSKSQELEADRYGTALAVAASYSPDGILQLLDRFQGLENQRRTSADGSASPLDEAAQISIQTLQDYFRSHPPSAERKQQIEILIRDERWSRSPTRRLRLTSGL